MAARAVAVIRPAPSIISLPAFLYILSGKPQLHASSANLVMTGPDYLRIADFQLQMRRANLEPARTHSQDRLPSYSESPQLGLRR
jgi:hypothetical protein